MPHRRSDRPGSTDTSELRVHSFQADLRLSTVADIARALSARMSFDELLELILERLTRALDAERSTLFRASDDSDELVSSIAQGAEMRPIRIRKGQGLAGWVAAMGRSVNVKDAYQDARFDSSSDDETGFRTRSMLCQPVFDRDGGLIAVVQVLNKKNGYFTVEDEVLLTTIMAMAAISIVNATLNNSVLFHNVKLSETQQQLAEKVSEIDLLYRIEREMGGAQDLDGAIEVLALRIGAVVPSSFVQIALSTGNRGLIAHRAVRGSQGIELVAFERWVGISRRVLETGSACNLCDIDPAEMPALTAAERLPFAPHNGLCLPLPGPDGVLGTLSVYDRPGKAQCLGEDDAKLLTLLSGQVARAIAQRQARDQAEREDRLSAVGRALASIMHDFRTPMTVASGYVQMLKNEDDKQERAELADLVLLQLDRIMQMSREVLAFARGEQTAFLRRILVAEFAKEAEELVRQIFAGTTIATSFDCRFRGPARVDSFKLLRVVQNIARNARDAMQDAPPDSRAAGNRFDVVIDADGDQLVLTFADNGRGVPPAFRHRLFDVFATQGKKDGTGLGLAMVKQFAEAHGGSVVHRDTPGGGATFEMRIARDPRPGSSPTTSQVVDIAHVDGARQQARESA